MKYRALRRIHGDYGTKDPGEIFEVPEVLVRKFARLEAKGIVERYVPTQYSGRKAYQVFQSKMQPPPENKMMPSPENKSSEDAPRDDSFRRRRRHRR